MGIRFSKSIKLGNYLRLNLSGSGVSATVGKSGASVSLGKNGTFLNLSPSAVGIKGTGLSYRQKISSNSISSLFGGGKKQETKSIASAAAAAISDAESGAISGTSSNIPAYLADKVKRPNPTGSAAKQSAGKTSVQAASTPASQSSSIQLNVTAVLEEYEKNKEARVHIHRYAEPVMDRAEFDARIESSASEAGKALYRLCLEKDEDTIENFVSTFMNNLDLPYDVRVNYEYEDGTLFADLDLPEIEDLSPDYPAVVKGQIIRKKKNATDLREEYAETVLSLGVFMAASFFNVSPTIETVVLSGFTTVRNQDGDPVDKYLYSVKFVRQTFEETDLASLDNLRSFYLKFENRINLSTTNLFKAITPFVQEEAAEEENPELEEAAMALAGLGFPEKSIRAILPELSKEPCDSVQDYIRTGLKMLRSE